MSCRHNSLEIQEDKVSLKEYTRKGTQKGILALIFEDNIGEWLTKREVEKQLVLRWSFRNLNDIREFNDFNDLIKNAEHVPGDIQRDLRLFFDKFSKYGLEKKEKSKENGLSYRWNPIYKSELNDIISPAARNIFKTKEEQEKFFNEKCNKCEMCGKSKSENDVLRMAVDHWRAHSIYNIDNREIAVLLCEKCNNIHHNYDASKIASKYKSNINIVKNWVKKEKEIRKLGFAPNEEDLKTQKAVIAEITNHYESLNSINDDFWEGLNQ
jgi:hypothetical protein